MKVIVSDVLGNKKKKYVGFSWLYMFFGPFYLLCRGKVLSFLLLVIRGSTYILSALALGTVVLILLLRIKEAAILDNMAFRCALVRLR